jgi:hypothetical protein
VIYRQNGEKMSLKATFFEEKFALFWQQKGRFLTLRKVEF